MRQHCLETKSVPHIISVLLLFVCVARGAGNHYKMAKNMVACPAALKSYPLIFNMLIVGMLVIWLYCPLRLISIVHTMATAGNLTEEVAGARDLLSDITTPVWILTELIIYVCLSGQAVQRVRVMSCPLGSNPPSKMMEYFTIVISWIVGIASSAVQRVHQKHSKIQSLVGCLLCITILVAMYTICCKIAWKRPTIDQSANARLKFFVRNALVFPTKVAVIPLAGNMQQKARSSASRHKSNDNTGDVQVPDNHNCPDSGFRSMPSINNSPHSGDGEGLVFVRTKMHKEHFSYPDIDDKSKDDGCFTTPVLSLKKKKGQGEDSYGAENLDNVFSEGMKIISGNPVEIPIPRKRKQAFRQNFGDSPTESIDSCFLPGTPQLSPKRSAILNGSGQKKSWQNCVSSPDFRSSSKSNVPENNDKPVSTEPNQCCPPESDSANCSQASMALNPLKVLSPVSAVAMVSSTHLDNQLKHISGCTTSSSSLLIPQMKSTNDFVCESDLSVHSVSPMSSEDLLSPRKLQVPGNLSTDLHKTAGVEKSSSSVEQVVEHLETKIEEIDDDKDETENGYVDCKESLHSRHTIVDEEQISFGDMLKQFRSGMLNEEFSKQTDKAILLDLHGVEESLTDNAAVTDLFNANDKRMEADHENKLVSTQDSTQLDVYEFLNEAATTDYFITDGIPTYETPSSLENSLNGSAGQSELKKIKAQSRTNIDLVKVFKDVENVDACKKETGDDRNNLTMKLDEDLGIDPRFFKQHVDSMRLHMQSHESSCNSMVNMVAIGAGDANNGSPVISTQGHVREGIVTFYYQIPCKIVMRAVHLETSPVMG